MSSSFTFGAPADRSTVQESFKDYISISRILLKYNLSTGVVMLWTLALVSSLFIGMIPLKMFLKFSKNLGLCNMLTCLDA